MLILSFSKTIIANQRLFHRNPLLTQSVRTLFSEQFLRISVYESHRMRLDNYAFDSKKLFYELRNNNLENVTQYTKQWIHKMDRHECESQFVLLQKCLRFIHKNTDDSKAYNFAPTVMRMLHFLNLPEKGLELFKDLQLTNMFQQLSCCLILCDMLFNNGMYKDVVNVIQKRSDELEKTNMKTSKHMNYLFFAASYKLNTPEHMNNALNWWNNCIKEHQLNQSVNFLCVLAINMKQPQLALELLSSFENDKHFSSTNIRILALSECGQFNEAIQIIEQILSQESYKYYRISSEVVERMQRNLSESSKDELLSSFNNLSNELQKQRRLTNVTIDRILCWPLSGGAISKSKRGEYSAGIEQ